MQTDVLIIGGEPSGSVSAMFLIREGIKPVIVEAETFLRQCFGQCYWFPMTDLELSDLRPVFR
jgi:2-polyprenyl-6-methoxyphenol hydroxylase-like FAD-dependent oxidoreductase